MFDNTLIRARYYLATHAPTPTPVALRRRRVDRLVATPVCGLVEIASRSSLAQCPLGNPGFGDLGAERQLCPLWSKSHEKWFFERFSLRYLGDVAVPKSCNEIFFLPNDPLPERFVQQKKSAAQPTAVHGLRPGVVDQTRRDLHV